jgi:hypothetical protein
MNNAYSLPSILDAINEINNKKKKTSSVSVDTDKTKKIILSSSSILPMTEKLILEAEQYSKDLKINSPVLQTIAEDILVLQSTSEDALILDEEYNIQNSETVNLEESKNNIIDSLYSSLSKKVKKNTLKTIFDLHQKINKLEKKIELLNINMQDKDPIHDEDHIQDEDPIQDEDRIQDIHSIYLDKNKKNFSKKKEHLINEDYLEDEDNLDNEDNFQIDEEYLLNKEENILSRDTIATLKQQNSIINSLKKNEEKLCLKVVDLEQDIFLLNKNKLDQQTPTTNKETIFYRENYERLIIENNDVKKKLINAKDQIIIFENNIKKLESGLKNLSSILSKNSIIKLNDSILKISPDSDPNASRISSKKSKLSAIDSDD